MNYYDITKEVTRMRAYSTAAVPTQSLLRGSFAPASPRVAAGCAMPSHSWAGASVENIEAGAGVRHFDGKPVQQNLDTSLPGGLESVRM